MQDTFSDQGFFLQNILEDNDIDSALQKNTASLEALDTALESGVKSQAQIVALKAAMESLKKWAEEQEQMFEKLQPKRIDWFEEQEKKNKENALTFTPSSLNAA